MLTPSIAQIALRFGANDLDGTVVEEKIYHDAGAKTSEFTPRAELERLIRAAGRVPVERDTLYRPVDRSKMPPIVSTPRARTWSRSPSTYSAIRPAYQELSGRSEHLLPADVTASHSDVVFHGRVNKRANDLAPDDFQYFYDVCMVRPSEIPQRGVVESDLGELGHRVL